MDNDTLIDQARQLYAALHVKLLTMPAESKALIDRLDVLVQRAYRRYERRLNRCVICYQHRLVDCDREPGKHHTPCERRR